MVYSKPPPDKLAFDFDPIKSRIKLDTKLYMLCMQQQKLLIDQMIMRRKKYEAESQLIRESRKYPDAHGYAVGDLVLIKHAPSSVLKAPSRKLKRDWVGPFRIQSIIDDSHYMISDWTGQLSHKRFHVNRLKSFSLSLGKVKDGKLQTVHNTRELFRIWKCKVLFPSLQRTAVTEANYAKCFLPVFLFLHVRSMRWFGERL